ncbi:MAG TPA: aldehyde ferredoxin oxidoreductase C-terminal domain-containing protein [Planctomycetota bacterium]|nr:aldehyde ferredoxin oxidoreductase C-terminal domain-containing protein [Planctomycetota bacterium]HRR78586.1 aldehyde ferredoxin oxidoreductase C-terminal domain-containing protein [Planctomycetota bacterium]
MGALIRVRMGSLTATAEEVPSRLRALGGRAVTSAIVASEVPPACHPLAAENKLVIAPGLLAGTAAPCSGRLSIGAKSPLTGGIKESNSGGTAAQALGRLGLAAIVVEGRPTRDVPYLLFVDKAGSRLLEAPELKGLGNYDTVDLLHKRFGAKVACITIGMAGEMRLAAASIAITDVDGRPTRHCGRGGLGAVMGSKGLKAIVLDTDGLPRPASANAEAFAAAAKRFAKHLAAHPVTGQTLPLYGTNALANVINAAGAYPTRNFSAGTFEGVEAISGETERETILARKGNPRHPCHPGCTIGCSSVYPDRDGNFLSKGPEYETVWAHGADCGIADLDAIARMDRADDDIGLDTIEMGATIAVAMEGGLLPFGDAEGALRLLDEVRRGTPLGRILGSGAATTGKCFGVSRIPCVKGQAMPAYDPRAAKGIGVTYATSPMGADHTAGYAIAQNVLGVGGSVNPLKPDGQAALSAALQQATAAIDSTGLCLFVAFCVLDVPDAAQAVVDLINAHRGTSWSPEEYLETLGKATLRHERAFNRLAGFGALDDRLPEFMKTEPLAPHNSLFDVPDEDLDRVHAGL